MAYHMEWSFLALLKNKKKLFSKLCKSLWGQIGRPAKQPKMKKAALYIYEKRNRKKVDMECMWTK